MIQPVSNAHIKWRATMSAAPTIFIDPSGLISILRGRWLSEFAHVMTRAQLEAYMTQVEADVLAIAALPDCESWFRANLKVDIGKAAADSRYVVDATKSNRYYAWAPPWDEFTIVASDLGVQVNSARQFASILLHEVVHKIQEKEMGGGVFAMKYGIEYLIHDAVLRRGADQLPLERSAYDSRGACK